LKTTKLPYPPGDFGIWIIVYVELITFGALFIGYAFARRAEVELFNESQLLLNQQLGFMNTLILITSSFFIVNAISIIKKSSKTSEDFICYGTWCSFFTF
jgi:nitric oxide reductase NorE protein